MRYDTTNNNKINNNEVFFPLKVIGKKIFSRHQLHNRYVTGFAKTLSVTISAPIEIGGQTNQSPSACENRLPLCRLIFININN